MRLSRKRREQLILNFVRATQGRLVEDLGELLAVLMGGPVTEEELRRAIAWSLRRSKRLRSCVVIGARSCAPVTHQANRIVFEKNGRFQKVVCSPGKHLRLKKVAELGRVLIAAEQVAAA